MGTITISLLLMALLVVLGKVQSQDVTSFSIDEFQPNPNDLNLMYQGDAQVPHEETYLRLTKATEFQGEANSLGRVVYTPPVLFWAPGRQSSFETTIRFAITPSDNGAASHGLAFFIAPINFPIGEAGADLGVFKSGVASNVFAVEFDTSDSADPSNRHIGIDIESNESLNTTKFDSGTGDLVTARINYNPNTKMISVVATSRNQRAYLEYRYDLRDILRQRVQVGISAATGEVASDQGINDVYSWQFTSSLVRTDVKPKIREVV